MSEEQTTVENDKATEENLDVQENAQENSQEKKPLAEKTSDGYKLDFSKMREEVDNDLSSDTTSNDSDNTEVINGEVKDESADEDSLLVDVSNEEEVQEEVSDEVANEVQNDESDKEEKIVEVNPYADIEGLDKLASFIKETGGSVEDYIRVTADYSNASDEAVIKQYLKDTKKNFSQDDIDFYMEDEFSYDEEVDSEKDIKRKKLAFKEIASKAREHLGSLKDKYYNEVKLGSKLSPEHKEAVDFYNQYKEEQVEAQKKNDAQRTHFKKETENLFSNDFKGFDFSVGEKKFRHKVTNVDSVKQVQSDLGNVFSPFFDEKTGQLTDAKGYHKALYAATNADRIAETFYNQGVADYIKNNAKTSKNIQMDSRQTSQEYVNKGGVKVRVVPSEEGSNNFKVKLPKKFQKK